MPKTITYTVYSFNELSDEAKQKLEDVISLITSAELESDKIKYPRVSIRRY